MIEPITIINQIRDSDNYIESIYTNGGCYQFYKILKILYPEAKPYKVKMTYSDNYYNHIITCINNKYYDITGEVKISDFYAIEEVFNEEIDELERWSFAKHNWLFKICPNCGEEIRE